MTSLAFSGGQLFSADSWGRLSAWRFVDAEQVAKAHLSLESAHYGWIRGVAASGPTVVTCGKDGFIRRWNRGDGVKLTEFDAKTDVLSVAFAPGGRSAFAGDLFGTIREFELSSGKVTRTLEAKGLDASPPIKAPALKCSPSASTINCCAKIRRR